MATSTGSSIAKQQTATTSVVPEKKEKTRKSAVATGKVLYEQPLNERIRTFLRLEYLFNQAAYHLKRGSEWDSRAILQCILEILAIFENTNLKSEVFKELERHSINLKRHVWIECALVQAAGGKHGLHGCAVAYQYQDQLYGLPDLIEVVQ